MNVDEARRAMRGLKILLMVKIAVTAIFWCIPLLFFPESVFAALGFPAPQPMLFARLLGAAYLALLVGYHAGIRQLAQGLVPTSAIRAGIVANGMAFLVFACAGARSEWKEWGGGAQVFMWLCTCGALLMTIALFAYGRHFVRRSEPQESRKNVG
jgi:hypothetical protein